MLEWILTNHFSLGNTIFITVEWVSESSLCVRIGVASLMPGARGWFFYEGRVLDL